jgi:trehalose/maltose transport system substrate-binding protein
LTAALRQGLTRRIARGLGAAALALGPAAAATAAELTISCGANAADLAFCAPYAEAWGRANGHTVRIHTPPASTTDRLALLRQRFAARSNELDVVMVDVVWPGIVKDHLLDLRPYSGGAEAAHFPAIVANNTVDGRLLAMPWYTDAGLLYYRRDLLARHGLKPPATWDDLAAAARTVVAAERAAGNADFQGFVFQGRAYEGLSCNALEWVHSFGGGAIVDADGRISIANPRAAQALDQAASWIGDVAPQGVLNYAEEDARGVFQNGQALFMRNWPYAWSLAQAADSPVRGRVGVAPLPAGPGGRSAAALGGWQLAVSKYSRHPDAAAALVMHLTSAAIQKQRAIGGSYNPTVAALYRDPEVLAANPFMGELSGVFASAVARPSSVTGGRYPEVSRGFWEAAHAVMSGRASGEAALRQLAARLERTRRRGW